MREKILELEKIARLLDPDPDKRSDWNEKMLRYADDFLDGLERVKGFEKKQGNAADFYNFKIREEGKPIEEVLKILHNEVDSYGINPASGAHLGYIPGGGIYPTAMGDYLAAITNRYAGIFFANPGAVRLENQLTRWMC